MTKIFKMRFLMIFVFLFSFVSLNCAKEKERKTLFVILDGIPADVIESVVTPAIDEISGRGVYGRAYCGGTVGRYDQTPTISAVGYATILTSTWANKHNVWNNSPSPNYSYPTIFHTAKKQRKNYRTAIYSSWTDNRTVLLGEGLSQTDFLKIDYVFDGLDLDTINYPAEKNDYHIFKIDEAVSEAAAKGIKDNAPDLTWVYLWYTDDAGHLFGNGDYLNEYTAKADKQVARIWEAVKYREENFSEQWFVIITTDHGRGVSGYGHGGQHERERTCWIATNREANSRIKSPSLAITDINPTICRFMNWKLPNSTLWEQDGIPFIGKCDIESVDIEAKGDSIILKWKAISKIKKVKIYASFSNNFNKGGVDEWVEIAKVKGNDERFVFDRKRYNSILKPSSFIKFAIVADNNHLTTWWLEGK